MSTSLFRLGIAGLAVTLAGLVAVTYLRQRHRELSQREAGLRAELAAHRKLQEAWRRKQAGASAATMTATAAPAPQAEGAAPPPSNLARGSRIAEELASLPEYAPFQERSLRRTTLRRYGELFAELKLPKDREEALKQIYDDRQRDGMKAITTAYQQGHNQGSHEYGMLQKRVMDAAEAKLASLLSPEERQVLTRFENSALWRSVQQPELDEFMADRGMAPLAPAQRQALATAAGEARASLDTSPKSKLNEFERQRQRNARMLALATPALEPKQSALLADYLAFNLARGEIMGRLYYPDKPAGSVFMTVSITRP